MSLASAPNAVENINNPENVSILNIKMMLCSEAIDVKRHLEAKDLMFLDLIRIGVQLFARSRLLH